MALHPPGDSPNHTGAMVAFGVANAEQHAIPDGLPPADLHVTARWMGLAADLDADAVSAAVADLSALADRWFPFTLPAPDFEIAHLGDDEVRDQGWVAVALEWPHDDETLSLVMLHDQVAEILDTHGLDNASQFQGAWRAHMTLTYLPETEATEAFPEGRSYAGPDVTIDRIIVALAEDRIEIPMTGKTAAAVTAASTDRLLPEGWLPPASWFREIPDWLFDSGGLTHFVLRTDPADAELGRFAAIVYDDRYCYANITDECWSPPPSQVSGAAFNMTPIATAEGEELFAGEPSMLGGHPPDIKDLTVEQARAFHEDTGSQWVHATYYDVIADIDGWEEPVRLGVLLGAAKPSITVEQAGLVTGPASGEWFPERWRDPETGDVVESLELIAMARVTTPAIQVGMHERAKALQGQGASLPLALAASSGTAPTTQRMGWVRYSNGAMAGPHATPAVASTLVASVRPPLGPECGCPTTASTTTTEDPTAHIKEQDTMDTATLDTDTGSTDLLDMVSSLSEDKLAALRDLVAGPVTETERLEAIVDARLAASAEPEGDGSDEGEDGPAAAELDPEDDARVAALETAVAELIAHVGELEAHIVEMAIDTEPEEEMAEVEAAA